MSTWGSVFGIPQWGTVPWGAFPDPIVPPSVLDLGNSINDVWFRLGFQNANDMLASFWASATELNQFADDAVKALAYGSSLFLVVDLSTAVTPGTALYSLPARHVFSVFSWLAYASPPSVRTLRPSTVQQLDSLDATWPATAADPGRISLDAARVGTLTLYPNPVRPATLGQVIEQIPAGPLLPVSAVLQDAFTYSILAGERGKESDYRMDDMAAHFTKRVELYEAVIQHIWGPPR